MIQAFATTLIICVLLLISGTVDLFDAPQEFKPERFLTRLTGLKPSVNTDGHRSSMTFGFGKVRLGI
jgi:cytochrome P450